MGRTTVYLCDLCGGTAGVTATCTARIHLWAPGQIRPGPAQRFDLCQTCFDKFVGFLETGRAKEDEE